MTTDIFENIENANEICKKALDSVLSKLGYEKSEKEIHPKSFETKCSKWTNFKSKHCFRLIFDHKENLFILEESPFITDPEKVSWADVQIVQFNPKLNNPNYWNEIAKVLIQAVE